MESTRQKPVQHARQIGRQVETLARAVVDSHSHFYRRADRFNFCCCDGVLVIRGCVPSFYLKQVLQAALQSLDGIRRIDNRVNVVSSYGLSSVDGIDE